MRFAACNICENVSLFFFFVKMCERDLEEERDAKFDMSMMNFSKFEGPVEKQLRETGEWVTNQTERGFRSNGNIFSFSFC